MTIAELILKLLDIFFQFWGKLLWPVAVILLLLTFRREITGILRAIEEGSLKFKAGPGGIDIEGHASKQMIMPSRTREYRVEARNVRTLMDEAFFGSAEGNWLKAIYKYSEALQHTPDNPIVLHNLAAVRIMNYLAGDRKEENLHLAIDDAKVCISLTSPQKMPGTLYNLARAQALLGDLKGLRESFNVMMSFDMPLNLARAIKSDPDFRDVQEIPEFRDIVGFYDRKYGQANRFLGNPIT